jgi:microcompartment protein CcmK/EutM
VKLGRVIGSITSTVNHSFYDDRKLLVVELTDGAFESLGSQLIAIDTVQAGVGDRVLVLDEGNGARQVLDDTSAPVRSVIVGVVDDVALT